MRQKFFEFVRFNMVGAVCSALNLALLIIGIERLHWHYLVVNLAAYMVAVVLSYFLNARFTFGNQGRSDGQLLKFAAYLGMRLLIVAVDSAMMFALVSGLRLNVYIAKIGLVIVTTAASYGFSRSLLKPKAKDDRDGGRGNMRILVLLNYYYPYISGLSISSGCIAEELARRGHDVTVVASNHAKVQPTETINGVKVIRMPVWLKISKGVISPGYITKAVALSRQSDVVIMNIPMLEAGLFSLLIQTPIYAMQHCEIMLSKGLANGFIQSVMDMSVKMCIRRCKALFVISTDYAAQSRVAGGFPDKCVECGTSIKEYRPNAEELAKKPHAKKRIGFCGRIVEEKGIDVLLKAYAKLRAERDDIELYIGGVYENVAGGSMYPQLKRYIDDNHIADVVFTGSIPESEMERFYTSLDVFTLPSINSMESFGLVQVEAMRCGVPVVASDLPGVRTIVAKTGMGLVCKHGDADSLATCLKKVLDVPADFVKPLDVIESCYSTKKVVDVYLERINADMGERA